MFTLAFIASFLATLSLASPLARQTSGCSDNGVLNDGGFTLLAVYKNDTKIQKPLAIGSNTNADPVGWLGSAESLNLVVAKDFTMVNGGITAKRANGGEAAVSEQVEKDNGLLLFNRSTTATGRHLAPVEAYCERVSTDPEGPEFPFTLAVDGDGDRFYLCQGSHNANDAGAFAVIHNPTKSGAANAGIKYNTCIGVDIAIIHKGQS